MKPLLRRLVVATVATLVVTVLTLTLTLIARGQAAQRQQLSDSPALHEPLRGSSLLSPQPHIHNRVSVDGSVNPAEIPDDVAYSLFLRMALRSALPNGTARQRSYIKHVLREARAGQSTDSAALDEELGLVVALLREIEPNVRAFDVQRLQLESAGTMQADDVKEARRRVLADARDAIASRLPAATVQRLDWYVRERFKTKVKIIF